MFLIAGNNVIYLFHKALSESSICNSAGSTTIYIYCIICIHFHYNFYFCEPPVQWILGLFSRGKVAGAWH